FQPQRLGFRRIELVSLSVDDAESFHLIDPFPSLLFPQIKELINELDGHGELRTLLDKRLSELCQIAGMERFQAILKARFVTFVLSCPGMDYNAAANRALSGFVTQYEMIAA